MAVPVKVADWVPAETATERVAVLVPAASAVREVNCTVTAQLTPWASMVKRGVPQVDVAAVFRTRAKVCHGGIPWANTIWKGPDRFWISFISGSAAGPCPQPVVAVAVSVPALPPAVTVFGGSHCGSLLNG